MKIEVTPTGIEPANFRLLAQCLTQLRHRVPRNFDVMSRDSSLNHVFNFLRSRVTKLRKVKHQIYLKIKITTTE
jgi:hypothetical protein